jgi:tetratricopeptide (TPR) repeat protein
MIDMQNSLDEALRLHKSGRIGDAIHLYTRILSSKKSDANLLYLLGTAHAQIGQLEQAIKQLNRSVVLDPKNAAAHKNLGVALHILKRSDAALASFDRAIALKPDDAEAYANRGQALRSLARLDDALASFDREIELSPGSAAAHNDRATVLSELGRFDEALASSDRAIALNPDYAEAYSNRGKALKDLGRLEEALASYERAIELNPHLAEVHSNRGNALRDLGRLDEAMTSYDRAIALMPDYAEAYWNKSLLLLLRGQYVEGWRLYEWRLKTGHATNADRVASPRWWRGQEDVRGKRLLILSEQGYGDHVQFCRFLPQLSPLGAELVFEVPPPLVSFVQTLNCEMTVVARGNPLPSFDICCRIMSLPMILGTKVETIPADVPYLFADRTKVEAWSRKLDVDGRERLRVGLAWSGSRTHKGDANRSIPLAALLPIAELPVELHSLQPECRQHDLETLRQHEEIRQHQDDLRDFSDTAALIGCLDLVISVDTSVAHVAGALGKPVWIVLPFIPDHRWMLDRADSPWYPTARLFRQIRIGDWQTVINEVVSSLRDLV